ncbi:MAG: DUF58 domain-containing protein [Armatimonadetes bacterium]|nr:DUF58 domain-containing protein [Armatimonadota bacterium]MDW8026944.1 DUF58 domain-containing protein [Armatimonadota bacterium]
MIAMRAALTKLMGLREKVKIWFQRWQGDGRKPMNQPASPTEILRRVKRLEMKLRRLVSEMFLGAYESIFKGQGLEFEEVREYQAGDDVRMIDWNVTARMGKPYVKKFRHERELRVFIVVDISPSLQFGTQGKLKSELAVEVASALILAAIRSNDRVGLLLFTDRIEKFIPPRKGIRHAHRLIRELLFTKPEGHGTSLTVAFEFLRRLSRRRRSLIFLFTDFHAQGYESTLKKLAVRHEVLALILRDRRERALAPLGVARFFDLETGEERWLDLRSPKIVDLWQQQLELEWQRRRQLLTQLRVDYAEVTPGESPLLPLMELFKRRERRLRSGR